MCWFECVIVAVVQHLSRHELQTPVEECLVDESTENAHVN